MHLHDDQLQLMLHAWTLLCTTYFPCIIGYADDFCFQLRKRYTNGKTVDSPCGAAVQGVDHCAMLSSDYVLSCTYIYFHKRNYRPANCSIAIAVPDTMSHSVRQYPPANEQITTNPEQTMKSVDIILWRQTAVSRIYAYIISQLGTP